MIPTILTTETRRRGEIECGSPHVSEGAIGFTRTLFLLFCLCLCVSAMDTFAQEQPPSPAAPKSVSIPAVKETKLKNGLTVAVVERKSSPLVTVYLLIKSGASSEGEAKAGLANLTADMLTKGTKTRTATQIAEQIEFLGGSINTGAGWNSSFVSITVTPDKLDKAMAIMADVVLNPAFKQEELDLLKTQVLDGLTYNLKQPGFLANYVASKYSFGEHPAGGTPASLSAIGRTDLESFHKKSFRPENAILIFAGDLSSSTVAATSQKVFGGWLPGAKTYDAWGGDPSRPAGILFKRLLVVDLPNSGQAAVNYAKSLNGISRERTDYYYPGSVLNSVLGGGYSSRLNYEIRIKRGLSYGAGSSFAWRFGKTNFATRTQTKNESAAEVTELVLAEVKRLTEGAVPSEELTPRKSVLTGGFGRGLETTSGLAGALAELYSFGIQTGELNRYVGSVNAVTDVQIRDFAKQNLLGGDVIIVGDYSMFKDDLAKRFPAIKVEVIKAADLDLSKL